MMDANISLPAPGTPALSIRSGRRYNAEKIPTGARCSRSQADAAAPPTQLNSAGLYK